MEACICRELRVEARDECVALAQSDDLCVVLWAHAEHGRRRAAVVRGPREWRRDGSRRHGVVG